MSQTPLIIGHRGASAQAPENTLAAFQMALDAGADGVEFDVQLSKDGVPVVIHDPNLLRTAAVDAKVADLASTELAQVDAGSWFNKAHPELADDLFVGQYIPTLSEVLRVVGWADGPIYIELKSETPDVEALCAAVCMEIRDSNLLPRIIVKSFRLGAIPMVRLLCPEVQTAALFAPNVKNLLKRKKHIIAIAREIGAHQLSLHFSLATPKLTALAAEANMPVTIWTADNRKWIKRCRKLGIKALITNDPTRLIAAA
ncbi:MAG: glycerophosphodiester phosphodiesterase family protein [Acidobacteriota bacterium]